MIMVSNNYQELRGMSYKDILDIRLKRQKESHEVEYFDGIRLDPDTIPSGKHMYHTRHSDTDMTEPRTIAPEGMSIMVNFCGTIVSDTPLDVKEETKLMYVSWVA